MRRPFLRFLLLLALLTFPFAACGPMLNGHSGGQGPNFSFVIVVHNNDVAYAETASVCWWQGSAIVGSATRLMPAGGSVAIPVGPMPDGFEVDTLAWPAPYGAVWQTPDYNDCYIFHVAYPQGTTWKDPMPTKR
jgi:hypothetical protein